MNIGLMMLNIQFASLKRISDIKSLGLEKDEELRLIKEQEAILNAFSRESERRREIEESEKREKPPIIHSILSESKYIILDLLEWAIGTAVMVIVSTISTLFMIFIAYGVILGVFGVIQLFIRGY